MHAMPKPTWPVTECTLATPRPTAPGLVECTHTVSVPACTGPTTSYSTVSTHAVPGPMLPEGKPQPDTSSLVAQPSTLPARALTQPQLVLIKQFQQPKPYTGASSRKGYREYFERLAAVNGWVTPEQRAEQLALALEGPATEVLRGLDTSQPQAYNTIWEALARRFGSLDGAPEAMRRFESRRQEDSETIPDFVLCIKRLGLRPPLNRGMQHLKDALKMACCQQKWSSFCACMPGI